MPETTATSAVLPPPARRVGTGGLVPAAALLWGLQFAFLSPALALLLVDVFGASGAQVGAVLAVYNSAGFVFSLVLPAYADRTGEDLPLLLACGVLTVGLVVALAASRSLLVATVALVVLGAPATSGTTLLFAYLRRTGFGPAAVLRTRSLLSVSWVAGPPVAAGVISAFGPRGILPMIAVVALGTIGVSGVLASASRRSGRREAQDDGGSAPSVPLGRGALIALAAVFVLLMAANSAAVSTMTLYVTKTLRADVTWAGVVLGVSAGLEVPAFLALGRLTRRVHPLTLVVSGVTAAVAYYVAAAAAPGPVVLVALQPLNSWFFAVVAGIGLTVAQSQTTRPGLATGLYNNAMRVGMILSGPLIAFASTTAMGYRGVFVGGAGLAAVALVAVPVVAWRAPHVRESLASAR